MMRRSFLAAQLVLVFLTVCNPIAYADPLTFIDPFADRLTFIFSTLPGTGSVAGPAGSTVGWGYSITNTSDTNWLVLNGISAGSFANGSPKELFDFPILAPGTTATLEYDALNSLGLYQLTWDPTAPDGFVNSGNFVASAEWWDGDPFADGKFLAAADDQKAAYSAMVTATAVPAPSTLLLMAIGLAAIWLRSGRGAAKQV
jgi:hypothetical protein